MLSLRSMMQEKPQVSRFAQVNVPEHWDQQIHSMWENSLVGMPEGLKVHPATADAFGKLAQSRADWDTTQCAIYVDGSVSAKGKAWGMVVTLRGAHRGDDVSKVFALELSLQAQTTHSG